MKFGCLVIDPPYSFSDKLSMSEIKRGAEANYSTMSNEDLFKLPIKEIADPDGALLALWVPSSLLQLGLDLMKAYGFRQTQTFIWVKTKKEPLIELIAEIKRNIKNKSIKEVIEEIRLISENFSINSITSLFLGRLFRQSHELCLIGINNTKIYQKLKNKSQRSVCLAPNLKHSSKPELLQDSLELMLPEVKKIEIFGRRSRPGWTVLGNQSPESFGIDIFDSLNEIIKD